MKIHKLIHMFQCNRETSLYYLLLPPPFGKGAFVPLGLKPLALCVYNMFELRCCPQ